MDIAGSKVVVVGGGSGMGRASAVRLATCGASVAILDRDPEPGKAVATEVGGTFHQVDVTDFDGFEQIFADAVDSLGGLHVAVTTAGGQRTPDGVLARRTLSKDGPHDLDAFRYLQDLNTVGTFNVSRLAAFWMSSNEPVNDERGVIINTSSIAAYEGQIGQIGYAAAKAAIAAMSLTMARDLGSLGIRVLAIAPSLFMSPAARANLTPEWQASLLGNAAFPKRPGEPEEYAQLVEAIVTNQMLNGQCIRLDAGNRFGSK
ncbi:SDR family NAD(P)-dependent oxidoreductase [Mycobacterium sp. 94-17]|uniref:SDR family NAD(P)-dependent oxidoreductase n=1 Tax=Mycobacterium sp. 94-17 TaxID=2986147 RepID=UPI002D1EE596|nr:SDR family NAD(P)-dependent oxidoreductase [Mycobacterium sp. 94-17]MEB4209754.1 SDR family NAD(P)-dependent oxidoreductase [Mycobacterium sp. 94-17]